MPRFFIESSQTLPQAGDCMSIDGENGRHISKSLRMKPGEKITVCDGRGNDCDCTISDISGELVTTQVNKVCKSQSEPSVFVTLYQCLPKSDKMELIIQKLTELGISRIVPVNSEFCIAKISGKEDKKLARWQKIALEAAKQSGRGIVPKIESPINFSQAVKNAPGEKIMLYEGGGEPLRNLVHDTDKEISFFVGPEGGFSVNELELAKVNHVKIATLGPRILRTETAPIAAVTVIMSETGNLD
jgi:16S rRNA (uracil1498-N3)-methyltransferase